MVTDLNIAIVMGSKTDMPAVKPASDLLDTWNINYQVRVLSAHRTPLELEEYIKQCEEENCKVYIVAAGMAAHLAGVIAARTIRPVIGIPMGGKMLGLDSLFSTVQMPGGYPVATVAVDGARNAAILAAQILAIQDIKIRQLLIDFRRKMRDDTMS
jgi:5-(carboxyamino)imidazole ribonucleotide mutase